MSIGLIKLQMISTLSQIIESQHLMIPFQRWQDISPISREQTKYWPFFPHVYCIASTKKYCLIIVSLSNHPKEEMIFILCQYQSNRVKKIKVFDISCLPIYRAISGELQVVLGASGARNIPPRNRDRLRLLKNIENILVLRRSQTFRTPQPTLRECQKRQFFLLLMLLKNRPLFQQFKINLLLFLGKCMHFYLLVLYL